MAHVVKNPALPDYFLSLPGITRKTSPEKIPSVLRDYEDGKFLTFPNLRFNIDHDFWAGLPVAILPALAKMVCAVDADEQDSHIKRLLRKYEIPAEIGAALRPNISSLLKQVMPIYYRLFAGYAFSARRAVWRLAAVHNENLHLDTYKAESPEHLARMFINLDNQPHILNTSHPADGIFRNLRSRMPTGKLDVDANRFWSHFQQAAFGPGHPFDTEPRHSVFFDPGDVWIVDSRQVSRQTFYGRRLLSIDFAVTLDSMRDRRKHYLEIARNYQATIRRERELA